MLDLYCIYSLYYVIETIFNNTGNSTINQYIKYIPDTNAVPPINK